MFEPRMIFLCLNYSSKLLHYHHHLWTHIDRIAFTEGGNLYWLNHQSSLSWNNFGGFRSYFDLLWVGYFLLYPNVKKVSFLNNWNQKGSHLCTTCRCIEVAGAYVVQKKDVNISLTSIGALWTSADFFARGVNHDFCKAQGLSTSISLSRNLPQQEYFVSYTDKIGQLQDLSLILFLSDIHNAHACRTNERSLFTS